MSIKLDFEMFDDTELGVGKWAQDRYLVHGWDDVLWTDNWEDVVRFLKDSIINYQNEMKPNVN